jgi:HSP20 family molecular chaperone IbpA
MPGFKQKDVHVEVEKDVLRISAETKNRKFHSCKLLDEREYDLSRADAELADGILTVKIPKRERNESSVKQIDVKAR